MKLLLVNTYDKWGAANSCVRLHKGLLENGVNSSVLLRFKEKKIPFTDVIKPPIERISKFRRVKIKIRTILKEFGFFKKRPVSENEIFLKNRPKGLETFSFPDSNIDITTSKSFNEADIINLHWVANFLDFTSFFEKNKKPVVWTLHDMNPFSGGEHYLEKHLGIDESGFPVKRSRSAEELRILKKNISVKLKALSKVDDLTIVTPSAWLANEARKSEVFKKYPIYCIPYGLDSQIFKPRDKKYSRELLNIPVNKKVILFAADSIDNNRKGFIFLKKAFDEISDPNLVLCAIGDKKSDFPNSENILELGTINDELLMSVAYSAADVFVIPSLMDNFPNTVLESVMCGTPVIGFPVGGIPEMIENGVNGFLTDEISVKSLAATINQFLSNPDYFNRNTIRNDALNQYDQQVQAKKYIELFTSILNKQNN